jgi:hypothetical protein
MGTPRTSPTTLRLLAPLAAEHSSLPTSGDGLLEGFTAIAAFVADRDRQSAEDSARQLDAEDEFLAAFQGVCSTVVRPAMQSAIDRLASGGGSGLIVEHPGGEARFRRPSLAIWMSLEGDFKDEPHEDRHPYLAFEADVSRRQVYVSEGDRWHDAGGNTSGRVGTWDIADITGEKVVNELLQIACRAAKYPSALGGAAPAST